MTAEEIRAYISANWTSRTCPRCGAEDWAHGEPENLNGLLPLGSVKATMVAQTRETLPVVWLICSACGHIEMIALRAIEQWKSGRR